MKDIDIPMGNAELRLSLVGIENEIGDVKSIALSTHEQAFKTNGRVNWLMKLAYTSLGALPLMTAWVGWVTYNELHPHKVETEAIQAAVNRAFEDNLQTNP